MNKLQKALVKEWVEALRSGNYPQDTCQLKTSSGYCCLGVLVEVNQEWILSTTDTYCIDPLNKIIGCEKEFPPLEILCEYGISVTEARKLIRMNDVELKSFNQIADYIEKELLRDE